MRIGIISDTHLKKSGENINPILNEYLNEVDMIIHAGDYINKEVINRIKIFKKFIGVYGNVDDEKVKEVVKEKEIIEVMGYKIGIFHGHGRTKTTIDRVYKSFEDDSVDIIIFGHSHQPIVRTKNKILMINPGSPINKRKERWFSLAILTIDEGQLDVELKFFNKA